MSDKTTVKIIENVIILEVKYLLQGWPAYVINFMPEDTGPHKIILHLHNPSKYVTIDTDDEDKVPGAHPSEYSIGTLTTNSNARIMVPTPDHDSPSQPYESPEESSDDSDNESSSGKQTPPITVDVIPVNLNGVPYDIIPKKCKFFDEAWPAHCLQDFHNISANSSIASYEAFLTFPVAVKAAPEDTCGALDGEKTAGDNATVKN